MSLLKKFRLTPAGQKAKIIFFPKNSLGDPLFRKPVEALLDSDAFALLSRKDGRGKKYVEVISTAPQKPKE